MACRLLSALLLLAIPAAAQDYGVTYRFKVDVDGQPRKVAFFVPADLKRNEVLPLLVAVPDTRGFAFDEIGQWQQPAHEMRFAVVSVDITTSGARGWAPTDTLEMKRDMEAVVGAIAGAQEQAAEHDVTLDPFANVLTGHSGGTYLTLWLGLRRPDLFLGLCGRCCVFHPETVERGALDTVPPRFDMPIYLYSGQLDPSRSPRETELARQTLIKAGYTNVKLDVIEKMGHESRPEVFLEWYAKLLKETAKGRVEALRIRDDLARLEEDLAQGKSGAYSKLDKLVDREKKCGFAVGAQARLDAILADAHKLEEQAANLEADHQLFEAAAMLEQIEKQFNPLDVAKQARERRRVLIKSDEYKALEMLTEAKSLREKGADERADHLLEQIVEKYPDTLAAESARLLLRS